MLSRCNQTKRSSPRAPRAPRFLLLTSVVAALFTTPLFAQMPDMKQMSGIPRPVDDLPDGAISVRVIRGELANTITNQDVELGAGGKTQTVKTDQAGRAEFRGLAAGTPVKASTVVDGERLVSQEFPVPARGGVRLLLVATDNAAAAQAAQTPPVTGQVTLGGQSRIIIEPGDENLQVYYLMDITNNGKAPVNPIGPFMMDMPTGAVGTTLLEGSSPLASVNGTRLRVQGPFPPGTTLVQVAYEMPVFGSALTLSQKFPAPVDQLAVIMSKVAGAQLTSPQLTTQQDMSAQGQTYVAATGPAIPTGQAVSLTLDGLPHHSRVPRWTALTLAIAVIGIGLWAAMRPEDRAAIAAERKQLVARRDRLFGELVKLETDRRSGRVTGSRYADRREELVAALEHVYGALDDDTGPHPVDRAGLAA